MDVTRAGAAYIVNPLTGRKVEFANLYSHPRPRIASPACATSTCTAAEPTPELGRVLW